MPEFKPQSQSPDPQLAEWLAEYPAGLFDDKLYRGIELMDRYCLDLAIQLLHRLGVMEPLQRWHSPSTLCKELALSADFSPLLGWLLRRLAVSGFLAERERNGIRDYRLQGPAPDAGIAELRRNVLAIDPANAATLDLLDAAAAAYPGVARGEVGGEEALLGMGNVGCWLAFFHNSNPLYAVNNWVGATAAVNRLADRSCLRILEVGAGAGSASEALLSVLAERGLMERVERYWLTEPSPFLRRRSERAFKNRYPGLRLEFGTLDIDQPWQDQGAIEGGFDLIFGVNVFHVAKDLPFSLREAGTALAPAGWVVAGECLRPFPGQPVYIELVFQLLDSFTSSVTDPESVSGGGFLTPEQWRRAFGEAGFESVQITPDQERIREIYPRLLTGAVCATERLFHPPSKR